MAQKSANRKQTLGEDLERVDTQVVENNWLPPRDSDPDMLIQSLKEDSDSKQFQQDSSAERGKPRQNPHTIRTQKQRTEDDI